MQMSKADSKVEIQKAPFVSKITHFIHKNFLLILIFAYLTAAVCPQFGLALRNVEFGHAQFPDGDKVKITLSLLMLSFLLFNAGLGIKAQQLTGLWKRPAPLVSGFLANMAVPIILILALKGCMQLWHNPDELQNLLVGLALIISMPIAGSSTAWAQNANGNLSLSLGLIFLSTMLSPLTTPIVLNIFSHLTTGDYSSDLHELALQGTNAFMMLTVVLPSLLGVVSHFFLGELKIAAMQQYLKLANFVVLLLLNYSNACTILPQALAKPDMDFLAFVYACTLLMCTTAFGAGWLIAKWLRTDNPDKASLMFGLGMNNNGAGLVLASTTLADHPSVLLPMISYTLVQQIIAALIDWRLFKSNDRSSRRQL